MRMVNPGEETDSDEIAWEDQERINRFSRLHMRLQEAEEDLQKKKQEKEALDDLSMELELADESEPVMYKIGDAFLSLPLSRATAMLESDLASVDASISSLQEKAEECEKSMEELKVVLYARFGGAINLER